MSNSETKTPPALAKIWKVKPSKIVGFIRSGELEAFNVAVDPNGRPRFRITLDAIAEFQKRRSVAIPVPTPSTVSEPLPSTTPTVSEPLPNFRRRRRRRKKDPEVTKYFS